MTYRALPCPCGDAICADWVIDHPELRLAEPQARAVAALLNAMEMAKDDREITGIEIAVKLRLQREVERTTIDSVTIDVKVPRWSCVR
jgi:hypothetical protein